MAMKDFECVGSGNTWSDYKCKGCGTVYTIEMEDMMDCTWECPVCKKQKEENMANIVDDRARGMYDKFQVRRLDKRDVPGEKHHGCRYLVLDLDHDPAAVSGAMAYAIAIYQTHPLYAEDIFNLLYTIEKEAENERTIGTN